MGKIKFNARGDGMMHKDITNPDNWSFNFLDQETFIWLQYTGERATSNNQEVYDGDVCMATYKTTDETNQVTGKIAMVSFSWCLETDEEIYPLNQITIIDVLGNIYQNPELINQ